MPRRLAALLALAASLLLAPAVAGQASEATPDSAVTVHAEPVTEPVGPGDGAEVDLQVVGHCRGPGSSAYVGDRTIHLRAHPHWVGVHATPSDDTLTLPRGPCQDGVVTRNTTLHVDVGLGIPAFKQTRIQVLAQADDATAETQVPVQPDWYPAVDLQGPGEPVPAEAGETVRVPVSLANAGNGPTRVAFAVEEAADDLEVAAPDPLDLSAPVEADTVDPDGVGVSALAQVPVTVPADAEPGDRFPATLSVATAYSLDHSLEGPTTEAGFAVVVPSETSTAADGASEPSQAAALPAAGAALLLGGLAAARLRG